MTALNSIQFTQDLMEKILICRTMMQRITAIQLSAVNRMKPFIADRAINVVFDTW